MLCFFLTSSKCKVQQLTIYFGGDTTAGLLRSLLEDHCILMRFFSSMSIHVFLRYQDNMLSNVLHILSAWCHQCKESLWSKDIIKRYRLNCGKELGGHVMLREDSEDAILSLPGESKCPWCFLFIGNSKAFVRWTAASKVAEAAFICFSKETTT